MATKSTATPETLETLARIEKCADECFSSLALLTHHSNVAVWALLVGTVKRIEQEIAKFGDNCGLFDAALLNLGRFVPAAMKWVVDHGKPPSTIASRHWTRALDVKVTQALNYAKEYSDFISCFSLWHKDRQQLVEIRSPNCARFATPGLQRDRQVSAYQKGIRPTIGVYKRQRAEKIEQTPQVVALFSSALRSCKKKGLLRFDYGEPWDLWAALLSEYRSRIKSFARRNEALSLGLFSLADFNEFYAAFLTICATHEHLCFLWARKTGFFPLDSAVLVRTRSYWVDIISELSKVDREKCEAIISDLVFDFSRDYARLMVLQIQPFVPVDRSLMNLAVAPQFPLQSNSEENILRVCSMLRPAEFDSVSLEKESEMRAALLGASRHPVQGPISLPKPNPDIDLIVADETSSTIVLAEMKWIRKPTRPINAIEADLEVLRGVSQLQRVRRFLQDDPSHLKLLGKLPKAISEYGQVYYLLVARDHWTWVDPKEVAIVEFDAFAAALRESGGLQAAISSLLRYDWLPVEGRDFTTRFEPSIVNGVSIETEVFYSVV